MTRQLESPRSRIVIAICCVAGLIAAGCGDGGSSAYTAPTVSPSGYENPATAVENQRKDAKALSESSRLGHDAAMDAYDNIAP
jgi:hypothetical protein